MSYLLDSDICSSYLRKPGGPFHRFIQHSGHLSISSITLSDLYTWAYKQDDPNLILDKLQIFLHDMPVLDFDSDCALYLGKVRGSLLRQGISISPLDLLIASIAGVHNLTVVTHNTADFEKIPGIRLEDWLIP